MITTTITITCNSCGKSTFVKSGEDITRGVTVPMSQKEGWTYISAAEQHCPACVAAAKASKEAEKKAAADKVAAEKAAAKAADKKPAKVTKDKVAQTKVTKTGKADKAVKPVAKNGKNVKAAVEPKPIAGAVSTGKLAKSAKK